jgi:N5-(cytidine 5'-diphosphoramidyl)-L-glutamine hydrolase
MPIDPRRHRIGLTMREMEAPNHMERRDALAQDWGRFLAWSLPEAAWLPIPNLGEDATAFADRWALTGLILTGGEDIGVAPRRDATERALLGAFLERDLPVLGVCRGLQLLWTEAGGELQRGTQHVATRHAVRAQGHLDNVVEDGLVREVNSYHAWCLKPRVPAPGHSVVWRGDDGSVEGFVDGRVVGVMWHPEREPALDDMDRRLLRWLFLTQR